MASCNLTDICGICAGGSADDDNCSCCDCLGVPNGLASLDNCGVCVNCTEVDEDGNCPTDPQWDATCTGCTTLNQCNTGESILGGDCYWTTDGGLTSSNTCQWNPSDSYCQDSTPDGPAGCCWEATGICDCYDAIPDTLTCNNNTEADATCNNGTWSDPGCPGIIF